MGGAVAVVHGGGTPPGPGDSRVRGGGAVAGAPVRSIGGRPMALHCSLGQGEYFLDANPVCYVCV
jgi:hypothetical protein